MNRPGHVAVGVAATSAVLYIMEPGSLLFSSCALLGAAVGSLLPDLDHKTGTISNWIQPSASQRKWLNGIGVLLLFIGLFFWSKQSELAIGSLVVGTVALAMSRLRNIVLIGIGLLLFYNFISDGHWLYALFGIMFCILPFVKHRGLIHTPELAVLLSTLLVLYPTESLWLAAVLLGGIIGWWMHLVGDALGREGISSLFFPKVKVALRLLDNGSASERWLARGCWLLSAVLGCWLFVDGMGIT